MDDASGACSKWVSRSGPCSGSSCQGWGVVSQQRKTPRWCSEVASYSPGRIGVLVEACHVLLLITVHAYNAYCSCNKMPHIQRICLKALCSYISTDYSCQVLSNSLMFLIITYPCHFLGDRQWVSSGRVPQQTASGCALMWLCASVLYVQTNIFPSAEANSPYHFLEPYLMPLYIRVFSNDSALHTRWPKYSREYSGLISF